MSDLIVVIILQISRSSVPHSLDIPLSTFSILNRVIRIASKVSIQHSAIRIQGLVQNVTLLLIGHSIVVLTSGYLLVVLIKAATLVKSSKTSGNISSNKCPQNP